MKPRAREAKHNKIKRTIGRHNRTSLAGLQTELSGTWKIKKDSLREFHLRLFDYYSTHNTGYTWSLLLEKATKPQLNNKDHLRGNA